MTRFLREGIWFEGDPAFNPSYALLALLLMALVAGMILSFFKGTAPVQIVSIIALTLATIVVAICSTTQNKAALVAGVAGSVKLGAP